MSLQDEIDTRRREIHTDGYPISIGELGTMYADNELEIHPEFQRFFRWTDKQKSRLIESLLLGIPVPPVFVSQREDGVWDVVDGLQRLSTIFQFMGVLRDRNQQYLPPLELRGTEYLESLEGVYWDRDDLDGGGAGHRSLTNPQRLLLKRAKLDVRIIERESDPNAKYDLFQRLNTGGSQLSEQEVRNCLLLMLEPSFFEWISDLQAYEPFQNTVAITDRAREEQYDLELALRFLACSDADERTLSSIGDMAEFLTDSARQFALDAQYPRAEWTAQFHATFGRIDGALSDSAFRRYDPARDRFLGGFSVSAFEAITSGVLANLEAIEGSPDPNGCVVASTKLLWSIDEFRQNSGTGIRARDRIRKTIPVARTIFSPK